MGILSSSKLQYCLRRSRLDPDCETAKDSAGGWKVFLDYLKEIFDSVSCQAQL
jgi:hypothetical protein